MSEGDSIDSSGKECGSDNLTRKTDLPVQTPTNQGGGLGGCLPTDRTAASEQRLVRRAIRNRWPITPETLAKVASRAEALLDVEDDRVQASAAKTLTEMNKQNITIDLEEDKADRLDAGKATENVAATHKYIKGVDGEAL